MSIKIISHDNWGKVSVAIKEKVYTYWIDGGHIPHVLKLVERAPGKALQFLKKHAINWKRDK